MVIKVAINVESYQKVSHMESDFTMTSWPIGFLHVFSLSLVAVGLPVEGAGGCSSDEASPAFSCWSQPVEVVVQQDRSRGHTGTKEAPLC